MLRYWYILFIVILCCPQILYGQEEKTLTELGDEAFARQEYAVAANLYGRMAEKKGKRASLKLLEKTAQCYREMARFAEAGYWYLRMIEHPDCPTSIMAVYAELQKNMEEYDTAKVYLARFNPSNADSVQWKRMAIEGCDSALHWKKDTSTVGLDNIKELSSTGADWVSGVVKDGLLLVSNGYRKMALTTGAERNPDTDPRVNQPYFKAYVYKQYAKGSMANTYLEEVLPELLGKIPYHVGPVCFNRREDTVYVTLNVQNKDMVDKKKKGPVNGRRLMSLFLSVKKGDKWSPLVPLTELNYAGSYTGNAVLNSKGDVLYFMSDRPGGYGKTDIWYSEKQPNGQWSAPANCGPVINTRYEETFPTINEAEALYFSSKGHPGMGGFDIFRVTGNRAEWSELRNLRSPFNSGADDLGFIMKSNGYEGYFASNRRGGGGGDDVYHFMETHFTEKLTDPDAGKPVLPPPPPADDPTPPGLSTTDLAVIDKLEQLRFHYDYNSAILLTESRELLDRVAVVLQDYPDWKLMIRSHADSRGTDDYNMSLSARRCYAVIDYLIKKGLSPRKLYYENLGERELVNPCGDGVPCKENEHRENRRTVLKVIHP
jgi:outer membrane protein OmpA-like peptidoglycan-associated protein